MQHALKITDRLHGGKTGLAQIHLIAVFKRAHQLHSIERTEVQISFQVGLSG